MANSATSTARRTTARPRKKTYPKFTVSSLPNRKEMVSEAAYYIAEQRGFLPGNEVEDWLLAERQIDAQLSRL